MSASGTTPPWLARGWESKIVSCLSTASLAVKSSLCYVTGVSAPQVIEEIKRLSPAEQAEVIQFAIELAHIRPHASNELVVLALRIAESDDSAEVVRLKTSGTSGTSGCNGN